MGFSATIILPPERPQLGLIQSLEIGLFLKGRLWSSKKGVIGFTRLARMLVQVSKLARKSIAIGRGAENINAGVSLTTKLRQLETIQQTAAKNKGLARWTHSLL